MADQPSAMPDLQETPSAGAPASQPRVSHVFTVDVEEYFQVMAFQGTIQSADWDRWPSRAEAGVDRLLELLSEHGHHGTFFTVGWLADRQPSLVRRIADAGHEIGSHTWWHRPVDRMPQDEFREDVARTRGLLQDLTGQPVYGFRAPSFSIGPHTPWAFDVLVEEGHRYDSSIFPIRRPDYGDPSAPTVPYMIERPGGRMLELPLATTSVAGLRLPAAGGGYFRQLPYALTRRAFRQFDREGQSGVFYIHPWELDIDQPRVEAPLLSRMRHYTGLRRTEPRLERLMTEFRFTSAARRYGITEEWVAAMPA